MDQGALFFGSWEEALRDDVRAIGGPKMIGKLFYPEKDMEAAARALSDRLNSARRERLTDEQERLIIRMAGKTRGYSAALHFVCDDTQFERTKPLAPEDELAQLQRRFIDAAADVRAVGERIERLTKAPLQSIK